VGDIEDIFYKLDDVASYGITGLYKNDLHFVTPVEATIYNNNSQIVSTCAGCGEIPMNMILPL